MRRNWKPIAVIVVSLSLFGHSELFPPWLYEDENTSAVRPAGYHFYKSPPPLKPPSEMKNIFNLRDGEPTKFIWVHRDGIQLLAQRIVLGWLTINGFILSFGRGPLLIRVLVWLLFSVGVSIAARFFAGGLTWLRRRHLPMVLEWLPGLKALRVVAQVSAAEQIVAAGRDPANLSSTTGLPAGFRARPLNSIVRCYF